MMSLLIDVLTGVFVAYLIIETRDHIKHKKDVRAIENRRTEDIEFGDLVECVSQSPYYDEVKPGMLGIVKTDLLSNGEEASIEWGADVGKMLGFSPLSEKGPKTFHTVTYPLKRVRLVAKGIGKNRSQTW